MSTATVEVTEGSLSGPGLQRPQAISDEENNFLTALTSVSTSDTLFSQNAPAPRWDSAEAALLEIIFTDYTCCPARLPCVVKNLPWIKGNKRRFWGVGCFMIIVLASISILVTQAVLVQCNYTNDRSNTCQQATKQDIYGLGPRTGIYIHCAVTAVAQRIHIKQMRKHASLMRQVNMCLIWAFSCVIFFSSDVPDTQEVYIMLSLGNGVSWVSIGGGNLPALGLHENVFTVLVQHSTCFLWCFINYAYWCGTLCAFILKKAASHPCPQIPTRGWFIVPLPLQPRSGNLLDIYAKIILVLYLVFLLVLALRDVRYCWVLSKVLRLDSKQYRRSKLWLVIDLLFGFSARDIFQAFNWEPVSTCADRLSSFLEPHYQMNNFETSNQSAEEKKDEQAIAFEHLGLLWDICGFIFAILSVEYTIQLNRLSGANDLRSAGQMIPLVAAMGECFWIAMEAVMEYLTEARNTA